MSPLATAAKIAHHPLLAALAAAVPAASRHPNPFIHLMLSFGLVGVFLVSIVDSSFVPLPIPGVTDIMVVVLAAQHANLILLVGAATVGSFLGGLFSHKVGQAGGMAFLEKHVPAGIFKRVCIWMETHAILAVALPAILPPPMPLSPFVLAAGALKMPRKTFLTTFTVSRAIRHSIAAWLGIHYGRHIIRFWNRFSAQWGTTILIVLWTSILLSCAFAFWKLYKTSRAVGVTRQPKPEPSPTPAPTQA
jgi:membrane protein YqaA with SNARE-associated domain